MEKLEMCKTGNGPHWPPSHCQPKLWNENIELNLYDLGHYNKHHISNLTFIFMCDVFTFMQWQMHNRQVNNGQLYLALVALRATDSGKGVYLYPYLYDYLIFISMCDAFTFLRWQVNNGQLYLALLASNQLNDGGHNWVNGMLVNSIHWIPREW